MAASFVVVSLFSSAATASIISRGGAFSKCNWFGGEDPVPIYPLNVCTSHSHEDELDGLSLYSTKLECHSGNVVQYEYNSTECEGPTFNETAFSKNDGYHFNCDAETSCPYTKMIFWEFAEDPTNNKTEDGVHDDHRCAFNTQRYHEVTIITNLCIDLRPIEKYSFMIDCDADEVTYMEYNDTDCKVPSYKDDLFTIKEGCDDVFNMSAYVQIADCENDESFESADSDNPDAKEIDEHNHTMQDKLAVVFIVAIATVIIVLALMVIVGVVRKRKEAVRSVNALAESREPLTVDFQSIQDIDDDFTQQITTQGQEVDEIVLDNAPGALIIGDMK